ncbi:acyl-CoA dehydrogenase family protein [Pseudomonas sp. N040]|uniref:acyl-CoA dehydrogenase family protein n=1 Tax=Pseudomonas sp. N040 TaxID=2785325 RepID=UPI0018A29A6F|nr:acyl-CoA dehydrogenase family protein [Pseudomonas sp. N040]MBF7729196.1 acyl-CoA/acyl-ACP dehydrogenase [Pseudomonas sp. N040]MBW7012836.1 acyl-CoA/acyl-ACP dehydrogenase [Pseudomonas sp. N040]
MSELTIPSGISFELSDDERMMIDSVRRYCQTEIAAFVKAHGAETYIPTEKMRELLKGLTEFGFVGGPIAQEHGGLGLSWKTFGLLLEELCAVSLSIGITAFIQTMVATLAEKLLAPELRDKYLPQILSCDAIACMGISEPDVGSNVVEIKCKARPVEGGYALSGEKTWISNGDYADICICVARTGEAPAALDLFLVDRRESPFDSHNIHKMALNATSTAQLFFADCKVPEQHRLTQNGQGLRQVAGLFGVSRPLVGVFSVGVGRAALEAAVSYAQERKQHGKAIAGHQLISGYLAEMATKIDASRLLVLRALDLLDRGVRCESESAMAKWFATELGVEVTSLALQIHGGNGVTCEFPVERLFREARVCPIPEGTTEINKLIIGRGLTGIAAF